MIKQIPVALLVICLGAAAACAEPPRPILGTLDRLIVDKNTVLIRTDGKNLLPPLVVGRDMRLLDVDGREVVNLREAGNRVRENQPVEVRFRDEGKRHVVDVVRVLPR